VNIEPMDSAKAFARYVEIAPRLSTTNTWPARSEVRAHLGELVDDIDVFVLDGFGVLNVGWDPVAHAPARLDELRSAGCTIRVLTNGATQPSTVTHAKYQRWQMNIAADEVISSRDALALGLANRDDDLEWGFMAKEVSELSTLTPRHRLLGDDPQDYAAVDGFVLLGSGEWTLTRHALLRAALQERSRPVLVGNPDLVAPFAGDFSLEPGLYAHDLQDAGLATPEFFGKPFLNAFELVSETLGDVDPQRIAMVGDTLHTDILGGAVAGWKTVLVTGLGLMRDLDVERGIEVSGIRPDYIVQTT
jgi:HAD superfamily hydrolase (TIGR01450 family)